MKKLVLLIASVFALFVVHAQVSEADRSAAMHLVNQNRAALGFTTDDVHNSIVANTYIITGTDIRMLYLQQAYLGLPVYNQVHVLAFKNGKLVSSAGERIELMEAKTSGYNATPEVSASNALRTALIDRTGQAPEISVTPELMPGNKLNFGKLGVAHENITAELMWYPEENGKTVRLVWQIFVAPKTGSDYWLVRVDAHSDKVIGLYNLTVYCDWNKEGHSIEDHLVMQHDKKPAAPSVDLSYIFKKEEKADKWQYKKPFVVNNATYRVVRYPAESPQHPGGTPTTHTNPWTWAPGNATTLGWHSSDGINFYDSTRGNNVFAVEDRDGNNIPGLAAVSTTPQPDLTLDFVPDFTVDPTQRSPVPNQQFNTTNLFYWNNLVHDITYLYGFDEVSGNFQTNNLGRGGLGNDHVNADAQNPGNCNANFSTPVDGTSGRMQMFLCNNTSPPRDGDADNLVIVHEYGHGVSNRLTGGPSIVTCLGNSEQAGEGWSDYYGLMLTHDWATALPTDGFNNPRGVGTYLFGQPPSGAGIRPTRYSTNFAINPSTYANLPGQAIPHGVGYVFCTMLWEMTWEIIQQAGISPNLFDPSGTGGNVIAFKLVQEGMRLQPCSPGFVTARNAILRADTLFYGAQYSCAIWKAFARRGLGRNASQGLATSITDGVADFTVDNGAMSLTQNAPQIPELQNIVYNNTHTAGDCTAMTNFFSTDTLPTHVTWVSGGTYNAGDRTVTFSGINLSPGQSVTNTFTVNINAGAYFPPITHINDPVTTIAPDWTATSTTANIWTTSGASVRSAPLAFFTPNAAVTSDQILRTTNPITIPATPSAVTILSFWHRYITEAGWDGCVVEISTNGGTTWSDLGPFMSGARYNATLNASPNPLSGRQAFSGNVGASFVETRINLSSFSGQNVLIRFRLGSDNLIGATGWYIDDIVLKSEPYVYMKTSLFNAGGTLQNTRDTLTAILPANACEPGITGHPSDVTSCEGQNVSFAVVATGIPVTYQWQQSTNGGTTWTDISGATAATYAINGITLTMNGYQFRCEVTGTCDIDTSNIATLTVNPSPTHTNVTATPSTICTTSTGASTITGTATGGTVGSVTLGSSGTINLAIPDNNPAGVSSNINIGAGIIPAAANLQVRLNMTHTWVGDISVTLTSPCGTTFVFDRPGVPASTFGNSADLIGVYIFDINAASIIPESGGGVIAPGNYQPSKDANPGVAQSWTGITFPCNAAGIWTLSVSDNAAGDIGTLIDWAIINAGTGYTHSLAGPGTIVQNPPTGSNNENASFSVTNIPQGNNLYILTSTDALGCSAVSTVNVDVLQTPVITVTPSSATICAGTVVPLNVSTGTSQTFTSNTPITIPAGAPGTTSGPANPYPATINVSGLPTTGVSVKSVTINGVVHTFPADIDLLLQSPTGINVVLMSDVGGGADNTGENYTFDDNAASLMSTTTLNPSGTYRPTNNGATDTWVAPGPGSVTQATPAISMFGTGDMNGLWRMFIVDDAGGDVGSIASWSITFNVAGAVFSPTTGLFTDAGATVPYTGTPVQGTIYASPATTTTYNVTSSNGACVGTPVDVTITVNPAEAIINANPGPSICLGQSVTLTESGGTATSWSWSPGGATTQAITVSPTTTTTYTVTATSPGGCVKTANVTITVNPIPTGVTASASSNSICAGSAVNLFSTSNTAGTNFSQNFDGVTAPALPAGWTAINAAGPAPLWETSSVTPFSAPNAAFVNDPNVVSDKRLESPIITILTGPAQLTFRNNYILETNFDGGVLEISIGGGAFTDIITAGGSFVSGGYNGTISTAFQNPIGGRQAWTGNSGGYIITTVNLPAAATGQNIVLRWRMGSDNSVAGTGWRIDDIQLTSPPLTNTYSWTSSPPGFTSNQQNPVGVITNVTTTYTVTVTGAGGCTASASTTVNVVNATISTQPSNIAACPGDTRTFIVVATPPGTLSYQWQISTDGGATWTNIAGAIFPNLTLTLATAMNGNQYRSIVSGCGPDVISDPATLTVYNPVAITTQPADATVCAGANVTFTVAATGSPTPLGYQWQVSTNAGVSYTNIAGANSTSLTLNNVTTALNQNRYRCVITGYCGVVNSNGAILTVNGLTAVSVSPLPSRICLSDTLIALTGTPVGGVWSGVGVVGNNFLPVRTAVGTYTLTYTFTNASGCTSTATLTAKVEDCPERRRLLRNDAVIVYPNPNNGQFNIRINSTLYNYLGIRVYAANGALVHTQNFTGLQFGRVVPVDLRKLAAGVYNVKIYYDGGVRTADKTFKIIIGAH
jgi:subtilisin-like proprotein convertase family protein